MKNMMEFARSNKKVYVFLRDRQTWNEFCVDAETQGFTFSDGALPTQKRYSDIIALNNDKTLSYVGFTGRMCYAYGDCKKIVY